MTEQLTLSALWVGAKDLMVMRSLLNLAGGRDGGQTWTISDRPGGDVTLIDVDAPEGEDAWKTATQKGQSVIALARRKDFPARFLLNKPLRSREFLKLLTSVASGEAGQAPVTTATATATASGAAAAAMPSIWQGFELAPHEGFFTLAEHLRRQSWKKPVVLTQPGWPLLLIDPGSGAWFYDGSIADLAPSMFAQPMPASAGVAISSADLVERVQDLRQRPLSELKWYAGLAQSRGLLHPDLLGEVQFMLTQVPGEAMKNEELHRLAQILIRGPITLENLREQSGQTPETIMAFLNACYTSSKLLVNRVAKVSSF